MILKIATTEYNIIGLRFVALRNWTIAKSYWKRVQVIYYIFSGYYLNIVLFYLYVVCKSYSSQIG